MTQPFPWTQSYAPGVPDDLSLGTDDTFLGAIDDSLKAFSPRVAASALGSEWTYARIDKEARAMAAGFQALGLKPGARIAIKMPSLPQYFVAMLAIMRAGCVIVNVNPLYTARELKAQLGDSGAEAIILLEQFAASLQEVIEETPVRHVIVTSIGDLYGRPKKLLVDTVLRKVRKMVPEWSLPQAHRYARFIKSHSASPLTIHSPAPDDIAALQYTGGTTGVPKGAVLTQRNLLAAAKTAGAWLQPALDQAPRIDRPVFLIPLPLYHVFTLYVCSMGLFRGAQMELVPNPRDLDGLIAAMKRARFNLMIGLNTLYAGLLNHENIQSVDFSTARVFVAGGTATTRGTAESWKAKTGCDILEGWGMTETCGAGTCNPYPSPGFNNTIGLPMPGIEIEVRDDNSTVLPHTEAGEIWIKGPNVMQGYWQKPDATAEVMDDRGFLATGDIGKMDVTGYVTIVDRKKDMVLVSGFNVYPNEIEDVMSNMDGVAESAAIGIPDEKTGEAVKLFVVRGEGSTVTEDAVRAWCKDHLTNYKRPKQIAFLDELPKSAVGKVLRKDLREF